MGALFTNSPMVVVGSSFSHHWNTRFTRLLARAPTRGQSWPRADDGFNESKTGIISLFFVFSFLMLFPFIFKYILNMLFDDFR
jgi:hypothetical protein